MTIRDILDSGIEIQGRVEVRQWREETNDNLILCATESAVSVVFTEEVLDMEITYMWAMDETFIIEVK